MEYLEYSNPIDEDQIDFEFQWYLGRERYYDVKIIKETIIRELYRKPYLH